MTSIHQALRETTNLLRGIAQDRRIPLDVKNCLRQRVKELDKLLAESQKDA